MTLCWPLHARSAPGLSLMFPWGQDLGCGTRPHYIPADGRVNPVTFHFPAGNNSGKTFGSAGAVRGAALLASRNQQTSGTWQRTCTHTPEAQAFLSSPGTEQVGELLAFCLRSFQCKFMGAYSRLDCCLLPRHSPGGRAPPVGLARS